MVGKMNNCNACGASRYYQKSYIDKLYKLKNNMRPFVNDEHLHHIDVAIKEEERELEECGENDNGDMVPKADLSES